MGVVYREAVSRYTVITPKKKGRVFGGHISSAVYIAQQFSVITAIWNAGLTHIPNRGRTIQQSEVGFFVLFCFVFLKR